MELTKKQEEGLRIAVERYKAKEKYTVISGYAGAGKTTLVKFIVKALNIPEENLVYACFTGKAAQVLLKKGNKNVSTLHKLLYMSKPLRSGGYMHIPRDTLAPYRVVIIDECSMAPRKMIELLLQYPVYVIFLGDPFQLPPIDKEDDNHLLDNPHVFLDEIMRQAKESEIIQISMAIREGRPLPCFDGKDVKIFNKSDLSDGMLLWADQILCAKNETRIALNEKMRKLHGFEGLPVPGDKLIVLKNYWDNISTPSMDPLVNGTMGTIVDGYADWFELPQTLWPDGVNTFRGEFVSDTGENFGELIMDYNLVTDNTKQLPWRVEYALLKAHLDELIPKEVTYGYAITVHKAQGSQWDKVLVIEENFPFSREEHARWLYTAVTRAADKLVLIKK